MCAAHVLYFRALATRCRIRRRFDSLYFKSKVARPAPSDVVQLGRFERRCDSYPPETTTVEVIILCHPSSRLRCRHCPGYHSARARNHSLLACRRLRLRREVAETVQRRINKAVALRHKQETASSVHGRVQARPFGLTIV